MKIIFMGTPVFAKHTLEMLTPSRHDVAAVFCRPDQPKGRGRVISYSPVKSFALSQNIPLYQPSSLKDKGIFEIIQSINPDIIIVVAFGQLLPLNIINYPKFKCVNLHASLLPKYRGAAPINWALIKGEDETGITTMLMDEGLDTGDILLQEKIFISEEDNVMTLHDKLAILGAKKILETIDLLEKGSIKAIKQENEKASYGPKLKKEDGLINWNKKAKDIFHLIRGAYKWPGAYSFLKGKRIKIIEAMLPEIMRQGDPAMTLDVRQKGIEVAVKDGSLLITRLQPEGKPEMTAYNFTLGHKIKRGDYFESAA